VLCSLPEPRENARAENDPAHDRRRNRSEQYRAGSDILRPTDERIVFHGDAVGQRLDRGVQPFGGPYRRHRQDQRSPFTRGNSEVKPRQNHSERRREMNERISLRENERDNPAPGVREALQPCAEKSPLLLTFVTHPGWKSSLLFLRSRSRVRVLGVIVMIPVEFVLIVQRQLGGRMAFAGAAEDSKNGDDGKKDDPFHVYQTVAGGAGLPSLE
jgi:hypothetical protein